MIDAEYGLYSVIEVMRLLQCSRQNVHQLARKGRIRHVTYGLYDAASVDEYVRWKRDKGYKFNKKNKAPG